MDEAQERQRDVDEMSSRLAAVNDELTQSSSNVKALKEVVEAERASHIQSASNIKALEEVIEAERASHIQTKFSCELYQVCIKYNCPIMGLCFCVLLVSSSFNQYY